MSFHERARTVHERTLWLIFVASRALAGATPANARPATDGLFASAGGCQTTTQTTNRISIGMTQAQVIGAVGKPFSKSAAIIDGVPTETWIYKETTWDQGGWSWNRTISDSEVVFRNRHVVSFGVAKQRHIHRAPGDINVNVSHDE